MNLSNNWGRIKNVLSSISEFKMASSHCLSCPKPPKIFSFLWNNRRKAESLRVQRLKSAWKVKFQMWKQLAAALMWVFFLRLLCSVFSSYMPLTVGDKPAEVKWYVLCVISVFFVRNGAQVCERKRLLCVSRRGLSGGRADCSARRPARVCLQLQPASDVSTFTRVLSPTVYFCSTRYNRRFSARVTTPPPS